MNKTNIEKLIMLVRANKKALPYVNIYSNGNYAGWVSDFHIVDKQTGKSVCLNLACPQDRFILFAIASCWSRSGAWENGAYFGAYLKSLHEDPFTYWMDKNKIAEEKEKSSKVAEQIEQNGGLKPRKKVAFRSDFYDSLEVLAKNWESIEKSLKNSERQNDYMIFIDCISSMKGLGAGKRTMKIKIPLILRELRIQNIYENIPGKWCCVPDSRVIKAAKSDIFAIDLPNYCTTIPAVLKASERIYNLFTDLYDLPLFAFNDIEDLF